MKATVNVHEFKAALARLKPRAKYRSMHESHVAGTAGGGNLVLTGTLDSGASLAAVVDTPGQCMIPLESAIRVLSTYDGKRTVTIRAEPGGFWIEQLRFSVPHQR